MIWQQSYKKLNEKTNLFRIFCRPYGWGVQKRFQIMMLSASCIACNMYPNF